MTDITLVDRNDAKIKAITMEAPEAYQFGHVVKAEVEMRVGKLEFTEDKEGQMIRTVHLTIESCHIKESLDPSNQVAVGGGASVDSDDDSDDVLVDDTDDAAEPTDDEITEAFSNEVDDDEVPF